MVYKNGYKDFGYDYWIGLNDKENEGAWKWESGPYLTMCNTRRWGGWKSGQPDNKQLDREGKNEIIKGDKGNCAAVQWGGKAIGDVGCGTRRATMCLKGKLFLPAVTMYRAAL